jgi:hypothetical protein
MSNKMYQCQIWGLETKKIVEVEGEVLSENDWFWITKCANGHISGISKDGRKYYYPTRRQALQSALLSLEWEIENGKKNYDNKTLDRYVKPAMEIRKRLKEIDEPLPPPRIPAPIPEKKIGKLYSYHVGHEERWCETIDRVLPSRDVDKDMFRVVGRVADIIDEDEWTQTVVICGELFCLNKKESSRWKRSEKLALEGCLESIKETKEVMSSKFVEQMIPKGLEDKIRNYIKRLEKENKHNG